MNRKTLYAIKSRIIEAWGNGLYTELRWQRNSVRQLQIASLDEADETHPDYIGVFDGRVTLDDLRENLEVGV